MPTRHPVPHVHSGECQLPGGPGADPPFDGLKAIPAINLLATNAVGDMVTYAVPVRQPAGPMILSTG